MNAEAAARDDASYPGAHDGKDHADGENIKNIGQIAFRKLRPSPIGNRHKENTAEQAHISKAIRVEARLQKSKSFDTEDADQRV